MSITFNYVSSGTNNVELSVYHTYADGSRAYFYHRRVGETYWNYKTYILVPRWTTKYFDYTGLNSGIDYEFKVEIVDGSQASLPVLGTAYTTGSTTSSDTTSPTVNITSPSSGSYHSGSVTIYADAYDADSGVKKVNFYNPSLGTFEDTSSPYSKSFNIGSLPDGSHAFYARAYDNADNQSTQDSVSIFVDNTSPTCTIDSTSKTSTSITLNASASDSGSGVSGFYFYLDGVHKETIYNSSSASYEFTGLQENTPYTVGVKAFDKVGNNSTTKTESVTTLSGRPNDWEWTTAYEVINNKKYKKAGADYRVDDLEWNNFTDRINEFRTYKGYTTVTFTTVADNENFYATRFNEAKNAIGGMVATGISDRVKDDDVNASLFNTLMDKLNSL